MFDFIKVLEENPNGVLATSAADGKPATRVFQYLFAEGSRAYFCTSSEKPVYAQIQANPNVSFCTYPQDFTPVVSVNGKVVFVDDPALKARALDENPAIRGIYESPDNPVFKLFYIDAETVDTFSFAQGPQSFRL